MTGRTRSGVSVQRIRVAFIMPTVSARLFGRPGSIGSSEGFLRMMQIPSNEKRIQIEWPWLPVESEFTTTPEKDFWESWLRERKSLGSTVSYRLANRLRSDCVPLRHHHRGRSIDSVQHRNWIESFIHSWGVTSVVHVYFEFDQQLSLDESVDRVVADLYENGRPASVIREELSNAASELSRLFLGNISPDLHEGPVFTIVSLIDGDARTRSALPRRNSGIHRALHALAGGGRATPKPKDALVPIYNGATWEYEPNELLYQLDTGESALFLLFLGPIHYMMGEYHRQRVLNYTELTSLLHVLRWITDRGLDGGQVGDYRSHLRGLLVREFDKPHRMRGQSGQFFLRRHGLLDLLPTPPRSVGINGDVK